MDVIAVHVTGIAAVEARLAITKEHTNLVAVAIGQFSTNEACVVVDVHVDGSTASINFAPGTHTGCPQHGTVFEFGALGFTVSVSLILNGAPHQSSVNDRGVLGGQVEVAAQRSERVADLALRGTEHFGKDLTAFVSHQGISHVSLTRRGSIGSRRCVVAGDRGVDLAVLSINRYSRIKEGKIGFGNRSAVIRQTAFSRHRTRHFFTVVGSKQRILVGNDHLDLRAFVERQRTNLNVLTGHNTIGTTFVDRHVNLVFVESVTICTIGVILDFTLHRELVIVGINHTEDATVNYNLTVGMSRTIFTRHTEGVVEAQERTAFNNRTTTISVVTGHHQSTGTALNQLAVIQAVIKLVLNGISTLFVVFLAPFFGIFRIDRCIIDVGNFA